MQNEFFLVTSEILEYRVHVSHLDGHVHMVTKVTYSYLTLHPKFHRSCSNASRLAICTYIRCSRSAPGQVLFRRFPTMADLNPIIYLSTSLVQYISTPCAIRSPPFDSSSLPAMRLGPSGNRAPPKVHRCNATGEN